MFGVGVPELMVILVVALIFVGPRHLPEMAKMIGKAFSEFRRATSDLTEELNNARTMLEEEVRQADRSEQEKSTQSNQPTGSGQPEPTIRPETTAVPSSSPRQQKETPSGELR
jgi:Tat protein translocase TatB subunit